VRGLEGKYVGGEGRTPSFIMLVGEAPGVEESKRGRPFVGQAGKELTVYLRRAAMIERGTVYVTNMVKRHPPDNRDPTPAEIEEYGGILEREIAECMPTYVGALGRIAATWFMQWQEAPVMERVHGFAYACPRVTALTGKPAWVMPIYHPALGLHKRPMMKQIMEDFTAFGGLVRGNKTAVWTQSAEGVYVVGGGA